MIKIFLLHASFYHAESMCVKSVIQSGRSLFLSKITKNTSLKLPEGVFPLQLVNLHRNQRYFVIQLHTWFCLSYFLKTNIKFYCIYQYFIWVSTVFATPYLLLDTAARLQWPETHFSTFYQFFLKNVV
jgi:hypothetical protein